MLKRVFIFSLIFGFIFSVNVFATGTTVNSNDGSIFLEKLPGMKNLEEATRTAFQDKNGDINKPLKIYLDWLIQTSVVLGSILAVGLIIAGGVEYMTTGTFTGKSEGKERVTNAVLRHRGQVIGDRTIAITWLLYPWAVPVTSFWPQALRCQETTVSGSDWQKGRAWKRYSMHWVR